MKILITNKDLKYISNHFNEFGRKLCIRQHRTTIDTPQQNDLAEHMIMSILKWVSFVLFGGELSKSLLGEVFITGTYFIHICRSIKICIKTPIEV